MSFSKSSGTASSGERSVVRLSGLVQDGLCIAAVRIRSSPHVRDVLAVISTGMTLSTVQPELASELLLPMIDTETVLFAGDMVERSIDIAFATLEFENELGGQYFYEARLGVVPSSAPILLGTDFLEDGVFRLDMAASAWTWEVTAPN